MLAGSDGKAGREEDGVDPAALAVAVPDIGSPEIVNKLTTSIDIMREDHRPLRANISIGAPNRARIKENLALAVKDFGLRVANLDVGPRLNAKMNQSC